MSKRRGLPGSSAEKMASVMEEGLTRAAVIGSPVAHSLSPAIHNAVFAATGRTWSFEAVEVRPESLAEELSRLGREGFRGLSVTMPLKEVIGSLLASTDDIASTLSAVNCAAYRDGGWHGTNTDGDGCLEALKMHGGASCAGEVMLLAGAGGTARSIAFAAVREGMAVRVINRTRERAVSLVDMVRRHTSDADIDVWSMDGHQTFEVLVNATSVGMGSEAGGVVLAADLLVPEDVISGCKVVMDAIYQPLATPLLRAASLKNATTVDGLWMLIHQAVLQHRWWFGHEADFAMPDHVIMRAAAERELERRQQ